MPRAAATSRPTASAESELVRTPEASAPYHHGDLRRALVEAALALLEAEGRWDFTLRELARRAGVSHAAPYKHFADKRALLAEVAAIGFEALTAAMTAAVAACAGDPGDRFCATGLAYVRFGVGHAAHFRLMFGPEFAADRDRHPRLVAASKAAFAVLTAALDRCAEAGLVAAGAVEDQALAAWSLVHGLTLLVIDGWTVTPARDPEATDRLARTATAALFRGLGIRQPDDPESPAG